MIKPRYNDLLLIIAVVVLSSLTTFLSRVINGLVYTLINDFSLVAVTLSLVVGVLILFYLDIAVALIQIWRSNL